MELYFREDQRMRGPWVWTAVAIDVALVTLIVAGIAYKAAVGGLPGQPGPAAERAVYFVGALLLAVNGVALYLLFVAKLQVEVNPHGLFVRLYPFQRRVRRIDLDNIARARVVPVRPGRDYGGYGYRVRRDGKAYIMRGERGLRLDYANGFHLLLSTDHPEALLDAVARLLPGEVIEHAADADTPATAGY